MIKTFYRKFKRFKTGREIEFSIYFRSNNFAVGVGWLRTYYTVVHLHLFLINFRVRHWGPK